MAHVKDEAVLETSTTTSTGTYTTSGTAVTGYKTFASAKRDDNSTSLQVGDTVFYFAREVDSNGNVTGGYEFGLGTWGASNTLARTTVYRSSNSDAAVSWAAGTRYIGISALARRIALFDVENGMVMPNASADPSTPLAGFGVIFHKEIAGIGQLRFKNAQGLDHSLQNAFAYNRIETIRGGEATPVVLGGIPTVTVANNSAGAAPASTNLGTSLRNTVFASTATGGTLGTMVSTPLRYWRGNAAGLGGYRSVLRISLLALQSGMRVFAGLADSTTALTNVDYTTATTPGKIGLAIIANSGNWNLVYNLTGAAPTIVALGANFPVNTTDVLELELSCAPNASSVGYRVRNLSTGTETSGTISTNQPANTTFLCPSFAITNNATAAVASMRFYYWTGESDN